MIKGIKNPGTRVIITLLDELHGKKGLKIIQEALAKVGKPVKVDGIIGPVTIATIKTVNAKLLHVEVEKIILNEGEKESGSTSTRPKWVDIAYQELGVKEIHGKRNNPRVINYHSVAGGSGWSDEVPWCASFISFVMVKAGYPIPKYPARALSWLKFGVSSAIPVFGAIAVKKRKGGGHVTLVVGKSKDGKYIYGLGGNQNDEVSIHRYKASTFVDFRIPSGYIAKKDLPVMHGASGSIRES